MLPLSRSRRSSMPSIVLGPIPKLPEEKQLALKPKKGLMRKSLDPSMLQVQDTKKQKRDKSKRVSFGVVALRMYNKDDGEHIDMGSIHKFCPSDASPASVGSENVPPSNFQTRPEPTGPKPSLRELLEDKPESKLEVADDVFMDMTGEFLTADFKQHSASPERIPEQTPSPEQILSPEQAIDPSSNGPDFMAQFLQLEDSPKAQPRAGGADGTGENLASLEVDSPAQIEPTKSSLIHSPSMDMGSFLALTRELSSEAVLEPAVELSPTKQAEEVPRLETVDMDFTKNHSLIYEPQLNQDLDDANDDMEFTKNHSIIRAQLEKENVQPIGEVQPAQPRTVEDTSRAAKAADELEEENKTENVLDQSMDFTTNHSTIRKEAASLLETDMEFTKNHSVIRQQQPESPEMDDMELTRNHSVIRQQQPESPEMDDMEFTTNYSTIRQLAVEKKDEPVNIPKQPMTPLLARRTVAQSPMTGDRGSLLDLRLRRQSSIDMNTVDMDMTKNYSVLKELDAHKSPLRSPFRVLAKPSLAETPSEAPETPTSSVQLDTTDMEMTRNYSSILANHPPTPADDESEIDMEFTKNYSVIRQQIALEEVNAGSPSKKQKSPAKAAKSPIGKSPIGKSPIGKSPIGKSPIGKSPIDSGKSPIGTKKMLEESSPLASAESPVTTDSFSALLEADSPATPQESYLNTMDMDLTRNHSSIRVQHPIDATSEVDMEFTRNHSLIRQISHTTPDEAASDMEMEFTKNHSVIQNQLMLATPATPSDDERSQTDESVREETPAHEREYLNAGHTGFISMFCNTEGANTTEQKTSTVTDATTSNMTKRIFQDVLFGNASEKTADLPRLDKLATKSLNLANLFESVLAGKEPKTIDFRTNGFRSPAESNMSSPGEQSLEDMRELLQVSLSSSGSPSAPSPLDSSLDSSALTSPAVASPQRQMSKLSNSIQKLRSFRRSLGTTPLKPSARVAASPDTPDSLSSTTNHDGTIQSVADFFRAAGLQFEEPAAPPKSALRSSRKPLGQKVWPPTELKDILAAALVDTLEIDNLEKACLEIVHIAAEIKPTIASMISYLDANPPEIFEQFSELSDAKRAEEKSRLQQLQYCCSLEANDFWNQWRLSLAEGLRTRFTNRIAGTEADIQAMDYLIQWVEKLLAEAHSMTDPELNSYRRQAEANALKIRAMEAKVKQKRQEETIARQQIGELTKKRNEMRSHVADVQARSSELLDTQKNYAATLACTGCVPVALSERDEGSEITLSFGARRQFEARIQYDPNGKVLGSPTLVCKGAHQAFLAHMLNTLQENDWKGQHHHDVAGILTDHFRRLEALDKELLAMDNRFTVLRRVEKHVPTVVVFITSPKQSLQVELALRVSVSYPFDFLSAAVAVHHLMPLAPQHSSLQADIRDKIVPQTTGYGRITRIVDRIVTML